MTTVPRAALAAALGAVCLLVAAPAAQARQTPLTSPLSGLITIVVSPTSTLTVTGLSGTGSLGTTTVVDARPASTGYNVTVSSTGFDLVGPTPSLSATTHIPDSAVTVQVTGATGGTPIGTVTTLPSALPVLHLIYTSPVSLVALPSSYTLGVQLSIPAAAGRGLYTGTVTQTVV